MPAPEKSKSLGSWIWDAACSIRGAKDAPKYKDYILPLIFTKRLCDVFDDELNRIAAEVGSRKKAFQLAEMDWRKPVRAKRWSASTSPSCRITISAPHRGQSGAR
jgi:type I restriction-modification system DNA methylase subunit